MGINIFLAGLALQAGTPTAAPAPIIDMHMHALRVTDQGPPPLAMCTPFEDFPVWDQRRPYTEIFLERLKRPTCANPVWSPTTDEELFQQTRAAMEKRNMYGVLSGPHSAEWRARLPGRFLAATGFGDPATVPLDRLKQLRASGNLDVIGEVTTQYTGIAPTDPRLEPYWAWAEENDIPVEIHVGTGPFGVVYMGAGGYRARLHSALTMEEVLVRHPRLRVYLAHAGYPMIDDLLTLLYAHPQVHVDTGVIIFTQPRAAFYRYLQRIVEAGFAKRIMFGSDQMVWPGVIERSIKVIEDAPFLSAEQKRDILYHNAARFLRLSPEEIARHHRRKASK